MEDQINNLKYKSVTNEFQPLEASDYEFETRRRATTAQAKVMELEDVVKLLMKLLEPLVKKAEEDFTKGIQINITLDELVQKVLILESELLQIKLRLSKMD